MPKLSIAVRWPPGPVPLLICATYILMLLVAFWPASRALPGLQHLWALAMSVCRTEHGVRVLMTAAMAAHTLEGLYVIKLCWEAGLELEQLTGWFALALLLGYGAIFPLKRLIMTATKQAKEEAGKIS